MIRIVTAAAFAAVLLSAAAHARPHVVQPEVDRHRVDGASLGGVAALPRERRLRRHTPPRTRSAPVPTRYAADVTILGGRPPACYRFPKTARKWCGCAAAINVGMPNADGYWNLAAHWMSLPRAAPAPNMAAVRRDHVSILKRHLGGTVWMAYDPNSGGQLARLHPIDLRRYSAVVNPAGASRVRSGKKSAPTQWGAAASEPVAAVASALAAPALAVAVALDDARAFLIHTAVQGGTMRRQGVDQAIGHLHPKFAVRLAAALHEARKVPGLERAGCFSAYRPPAFGIGGYVNKFDSNHAYGLACDLAGIGRPGSAVYLVWHRIALRHGLHNPYFGTRAVWEFNHYQLTPTVTAVRAVPALRKTITRAGPVDPVRMWRVADALVDKQIGPAYSARRKAARPRRYASLR